MIPFVRDFDFEHGRLDQLTPWIGRVIADNPGPFTFTGTGTYIVGSADAGSGVAVIDPGPPDPRHLEALLRAVDGRRVSHVLVTHTHRDHSPLAHPLADAVGAPILAAQPPAHPTHASGHLDEADDATLLPDMILTGGEMIRGDGWTMEALSTPGHASNHMAFLLTQANALFCGDHVMGWSTTVVAPPDGDMTAYMHSLDTVIARRFDSLWPTHGAPILQPAPFLAAYRDHRLARESQIMAALADGSRRIADIVRQLYADIDDRLWPAASLSVQAHLIKLIAEGRVSCDGPPDLAALYARTV